MERKIRTSKKIKTFGEWAVTAYGIERCLNKRYEIEKSRLGEDWEFHMRESKSRQWMDHEEFEQALNFARKHFKIRQTQFIPGREEFVKI